MYKLSSQVKSQESISTNCAHVHGTECGAKVWEARCEEWARIKELFGIEIPTSISSVVDAHVSDRNSEDVWTSHWEIEDEIHDGESDNDGDEGEGQWKSAPAKKYVARQQELNEYDRLTRLWCMYPTKVSKRERDGAIRNEASKSHSIHEYLNNNDNNLTDSESWELRNKIEEETHAWYERGEGCQHHPLSSEERVDDTLDPNNCNDCKSMVLDIEDEMRDEMGLQITRRAKRRAREQGINFERLKAFPQF